jgi:ABC-type nitrate/sulfonate/bicarbonate transport system substrate-binding protein
MHTFCGWRPTRKRPGSQARWLACLAMTCAFSTQADTGPYYAAYGLTADSPAVDVGVQPLGYPAGVLTAALNHDAILRARLAAMGQPVQLHPFRRGADMLGLLEDTRLEAGLLGDMPTLLAAARGHVYIVGLAKQSPTAIVARNQTQLQGLRGKRVGYVEASSAHQTLLQGLASAGLGEKDVRLVSMSVDAMPDALKQGDIDAFAAWEPAPSIALTGNPEAKVVFRGYSSDYFVVSTRFADRYPAATDALVAAYVRGIEWLRLSQKNVERAARWAQQEAEVFSQRPSAFPVERIAAITRRDILNIPSAPSIIRNPKAPPPLLEEFEFLKRLGKIPGDGSWHRVTRALDNDILTRVLTQPREHETARFDYRD